MYNEEKEQLMKNYSETLTTDVDNNNIRPVAMGVIGVTCDPDFELIPLFVCLN